MLCSPTVSFISDLFWYQNFITIILLATSFFSVLSITQKNESIQNPNWANDFFSKSYKNYFSGLFHVHENFFLEILTKMDEISNPNFRLFEYFFFKKFVFSI